VMTCQRAKREKRDPPNEYAQEKERYRPRKGLSTD
jgi:hypothetical protein